MTETTEIPIYELTPEGRSLKIIVIPSPINCHVQIKFCLETRNHPAVDHGSFGGTVGLCLNIDQTRQLGMALMKATKKFEKPYDKHR